MRLRTAIWDAAVMSRGVCVLLQGQTEFMEKYGEVIAELQQRGFSVAAFDWRGQGGSQRALPDSRKAHVDDFSGYAEDLRAFLEQVVTPLSPEPPMALAHSMGGHILLRWLHDHPGTIKAAAFSAPMLAVQTRGQAEWLVPRVTAMMKAVGRGDAFVWGMEGRDPLKMSFARNLVTSDKARFARTQALIAAYPQLRLCGPTWGWLNAAYASMRIAAAPGYAEAIATPCLFVTVGQDKIVKTDAVRDFAARMPHARYVCIDDAEHEILMERDSIRAKFWRAFDDFTARDSIAQ